MLVDREADAEFHGYVRGGPEQVGFMLPVFRRRTSNLPLVQDIGPDGKVRALREAMVTNVIEDVATGIPAARKGTEALWVFIEESGRLHHGDRLSLSAVLAEIIDQQRDPFLRLQIAQFCELDAQMADRLRNAFVHMAALAPGSAGAWRDVVVVPAGVRAAIQQAILAHNLSAPVRSLGEEVASELEGQRLVVELAPTLLEQFERDDLAWDTVVRATSALRSAFDLQDGLIRRERLDRMEVERPALDRGPLVVGIGTLSARILHHLVGRSSGGPFGPALKDMPPFETFREGGPVLALRGTQLTSEVSMENLLSATDLRDTVAMVMTGVSPKALDCVEQAVQAAATSRGRVREVLAIVPHLPSDLHREEVHRAWTKLHGAFDAVWCISDRSPYARQASYFGPGQSVPATAGRLAKLIQLSSGDDFPLNSELHHSSKLMRVSVLGSATGETGAATLLQHCVSSVIQPALSLASAQLVVVSPKPDAVRDADPLMPLRQIMPDARIESVGDRTKGSRSRDLTIAALGVSLVDPRNGFEEFCLSLLKTHGWQLDRVAEGSVWIEVDHRPWTISFVEGSRITRRLSGVTRSGAARQVWFTDTMVRWRDYLQGALRGVAPVHVSRIPRLKPILRNHWRNALTLARSRYKQAAPLVLLVAEEILRQELGGDVQTSLSQKIRTAANPARQVEVLRDRIEVVLIYVLGDGPELNARLQVDVDGWTLLNDGSPGPSANARD